MIQPLRQIGCGLALLFAGAVQAQSEGPVTGMTFVPVPAGCYQMGAPTAKTYPPGMKPEGYQLGEIPQHRVCLDGFWLGRHEVTWGQWQQVMASGPLEPGQAVKPVAEVSWELVQHFIYRLNQLDAAATYRLPTEAEWEYACRAGDAAGDIDFYDMGRISALMEVAWFKKPGREDKTTLPVGQLDPNAWGLYDMLGNVWEWTADEYQADGYRLHETQNPLVDHGGERRVLRGASYQSDRFETRCGIRAWGIPSDPLPTVGFRLVRLPIQEVSQ